MKDREAPTPGALPEPERRAIASKEEAVAATKRLVAELKTVLANADWGLARAWIRFSFVIDEDQILLQGHTILERIIPTVLNAHFAAPCDFRKHFREYAAQLRLGLHTGIFDPAEFAALKYLSDLRGEVAHGQRERITFQDELVIREKFHGATAFRPHLTDPPPSSEFPGSLKYFLYLIGSVLFAKRDDGIPFTTPAWSTANDDRVARNLETVRQFAHYGLFTAVARAVGQRSRELEDSLIGALDMFASGEALKFDEWVQAVENATWKDGRLVDPQVDE